MYSSVDKTEKNKYFLFLFLRQGEQNYLATKQNVTQSSKNKKVLNLVQFQECKTVFNHIQATIKSSQILWFIFSCSEICKTRIKELLSAMHLYLIF